MQLQQLLGFVGIAAAHSSSVWWACSCVFLIRLRCPELAAHADIRSLLHCAVACCAVLRSLQAGKKQAVVAGVVEGSAAAQRRKVAGLNRSLDKESVKDGACSTALMKHRLCNMSHVTCLLRWKLAYLLCICCAVCGCCM
jgi:hypothetical protein